jgi:uncharacterized DUF497 family protein
MKIIPEPIEFDWDEGNIGKNEKHDVRETESGRLLFVAFTIRGNKVRIISARNINKKELPLYEEAT